MSRQCEPLARIESQHPCIANPDEVRALLNALLERQGLEAEILCTTLRLCIALPDHPSDFGTDGVMDLLAVVMAAGHLLKDVHRVEDDYVLGIDFWTRGHMTTTVGKSEEFSRRMAGGIVTPQEFWDAFDFQPSGNGG